MNNKVYWLGLNKVKGIGPVRFKALLDYFGDVQSAWEAPPEMLKASGLNDKVIQNMLHVRASVDLNALLEKLEAQNVQVITIEDDKYPRRLKDIAQPPPLLYMRGELTIQDEWAVAIVGTRKVTPYGEQVAEDVARFLANNKVTVVSGLARGVDSIAHAAALKAGGRTIGILGSGVDQIYPRENQGLATEIMENGAIISNYPMGTKPEAGNFPPRNRIIAGISIAVVIVEAGKKSGALITANYANEQGRDVYAVPGKIFSTQSMGPNQLIKDGAHPLLKPEDLIDALDLVMVTEKQSARQVLPADATEAALYSVLGFEPLHIDDIGREAKMPIEKVSATLALMELKGMVRQVGGMHYVSIREATAEYQTNGEQ